MHGSFRWRKQDCNTSSQTSGSLLFQKRTLIKLSNPNSCAENDFTQPKDLYKCAQLRFHKRSNNNNIIQLMFFDKLYTINLRIIDTTLSPLPLSHGATPTSSRIFRPLHLYPFKSFLPPCLVVRFPVDANVCRCRGP